MNQAALPLHQHDVVVLRALEYKLLSGARDEVGHHRVHRDAPSFDEDARLPCRHETGPMAALHERITQLQLRGHLDRKSTRLNSSHLVISYAVFCLKKKKSKIA